VEAGGAADGELLLGSTAGGSSVVLRPVPVRRGGATPAPASEGSSTPPMQSRANSDVLLVSTPSPDPGVSPSLSATARYLAGDDGRAGGAGSLRASTASRGSGATLGASRERLVAEEGAARRAAEDTQSGGEEEEEEEGLRPGTARTAGSSVAGGEDYRLVGRPRPETAPFRAEAGSAAKARGGGVGDLSRSLETSLLSVERAAGAARVGVRSLEGLPAAAAPAVGSSTAPLSPSPVDARDSRDKLHASAHAPRQARGQAVVSASVDTGAARAAAVEGQMLRALEVCRTSASGLRLPGRAAGVALAEIGARGSDGWQGSRESLIAEVETVLGARASRDRGELSEEGGEGVGTAVAQAASPREASDDEVEGEEGEDWRDREEGGEAGDDAAGEGLGVVLEDEESTRDVEEEWADTRDGATERTASEGGGARCIEGSPSRGAAAGRIVSFAAEEAGHEQESVAFDSAPTPLPARDSPTKEPAGFATKHAGNRIRRSLEVREFPGEEMFPRAAAAGADWLGLAESGGPHNEVDGNVLGEEQAGRSSDTAATGGGLLRGAVVPLAGAVAPEADLPHQLAGAPLDESLPKARPAAAFLPPTPVATPLASREFAPGELTHAQSLMTSNAAERKENGTAAALLIPSSPPSTDERAAALLIPSSPPSADEHESNADGSLGGVVHSSEARLDNYGGGDFVSRGVEEADLDRFKSAEAPEADLSQHLYGHGLEEVSPFSNKEEDDDAHVQWAVGAESGEPALGEVGGDHEENAMQASPARAAQARGEARVAPCSAGEALPRPRTAPATARGGGLAQGVAVAPNKVAGAGTVARPSQARVRMEIEQVQRALERRDEEVAQRAAEERQLLGRQAMQMLLSGKAPAAAPEFMPPRLTSLHPGLAAGRRAVPAALQVVPQRVLSLARGLGCCRATFERVAPSACTGLFRCALMTLLSPRFRMRRF
jgi:hypothetical protein